MQEEFTPNLLSAIKPKRTWQALLRDYSLYVVIGLAIVSVFVTAAVMDWPYDEIMLWFGSFVLWAFIAGFAVEKQTQVLKTPKAWLVLALSLVVHTLACLLVHRYADHQRTYVTLLGFMEYEILRTIFENVTATTKA